MSEKQTFDVDLVHEDNKERKKLQTINVMGRKSYSVDYNIIFKQISVTYKNLGVDITNKGEGILLVYMNFKTGTKQEVNIGETSYFSLKKG